MQGYGLKLILFYRSCVWSTEPKQNLIGLRRADNDFVRLLCGSCIWIPKCCTTLDWNPKAQLEPLCLLISPILCFKFWCEIGWNFKRNSNRATLHVFQIPCFHSRLSLSALCLFSEAKRLIDARGNQLKPVLKLLQHAPVSAAKIDLHYRSIHATLICKMWQMY